MGDGVGHGGRLRSAYVPPLSRRSASTTVPVTGRRVREKGWWSVSAGSARSGGEALRQPPKNTPLSGLPGPGTRRYRG
ncbi:hypothetical protein MicB006_2198 [Micromonospora sp. B006]|nr:hypothetical protein MicB006_2198 [Micromonospora sp. B006]